MDCADLSFSQQLHEKRTEMAKGILGVKVIDKILAYALFLLGATRSSISSQLNMPPGTIRSLVLGINKRGLVAFEDQRGTTSTFKPPAQPPPLTAVAEINDAELAIDFGTGNLVLHIPCSNVVQGRVVLLTLLNNGLVERPQVAEVLRLSTDRVGRLAKKLHREDVSGLIDKRQGHRHDYRFTPEVKAELIQQFVLDVISQGHTSGEKLAQNMAALFQRPFSSRSVLYHMANLGLSGIKKTLPILLAELKKTPPLRTEC